MDNRSLEKLMKRYPLLFTVLISLLSISAHAYDATNQGVVANEQINFALHEALTSAVSRFVKNKFPGYTVDTKNPRREILGKDSGYKKTSDIVWNYQGKEPSQILTVGFSLKDKGVFKWTLYDGTKNPSLIVRGTTSLMLK